MPSTEEQVISIILKHSGASKQQIARELNLGLGYIDFICWDLKKKGEITFRDGFYFSATTKNNFHQRILPSKKNRLSSRRSKRKKGTQNTFLGISKMTKELTKVLKGAGYKTIESLAKAPVVRLMQETKLELHEAAGLINQARRRVAAMAEHGKKNAQ